MKPLVADLSDSRRTFGVEIEMMVPSQAERRQAQDHIAAILNSNGLPSISRGYSSRPLPSGIALGVEYDASIQPPPVIVEGQRVTGIAFAQIELKTKTLTSVDEFEATIPKAVGNSCLEFIVSDLHSQVRQPIDAA